MEIIILGGIVVVVVAFNVAGGLFLAMRGVPTWDRTSHREAVAMAGSIVVAAVGISLVVFGVGALVAIWPFWLFLAVACGAAYGLSNWWVGRGERKAERAATSFDVVTWLAQNDRDGVGGQRSRAWLSEREQRRR